MFYWPNRWFIVQFSLLQRKICSIHTLNIPTSIVRNTVNIVTSMKHRSFLFKMIFEILHPSKLIKVKYKYLCKSYFTTTFCVVSRHSILRIFFYLGTLLQVTAEQLTTNYYEIAESCQFHEEIMLDMQRYFRFIRNLNLVCSE